MANNPQYLGGPGPPLHQMVGSIPPLQNIPPPMPPQFRPVAPMHPSQHFTPSSQQYQSLGPGIPPMNLGMPPSQSHQMQFAQSIQQAPPRPIPPGHLPLLSQPVPLPNVQLNRPMSSGLPQPGQDLQMQNNFPPASGGPPVAPTTYAPNAYATPQYQPVSQIGLQGNTLPGTPVMASTNQGAALFTPVQQTGQPSPSPSNIKTADSQSKLASSSDWIEHIKNGRRYYYNKKTRKSTWEKPVELMSLVEMADATTDWKEYTSLDGKTYFYNKVTKQSKWKIPDELKLAREHAEKASCINEIPVDSNVLASASLSDVRTPHNADNSVVNSTPVKVKPEADPCTSPTSSSPGLANLPQEEPGTQTNAVEAQPPSDDCAATPGTVDTSVASAETILVPMATLFISSPSSSWVSSHSPKFQSFPSLHHHVSLKHPKQQHFTKLKFSLQDDKERDNNSPSSSSSSSSVAFVDEVEESKTDDQQTHEVGDEKEDKDDLGDDAEILDWKNDEEFKKFMGNPSIEAAIKLEKKRADRKLKELDAESNSDNPVVGFFSRVARDSLIREKERLEKVEQAFKALDLNKLRNCFGFDTFFATDVRRFGDGGIFIGNLRRPIEEVMPKLQKKLSEAAGTEVLLWFMEEKKDDITKQVCLVQPKSEIDLQFESTKLSTPWGFVSAILLGVTTFGTIAITSGFFVKPGATFDDYLADVIPLFGGFLTILGVSEIATRVTANRYGVKLSPSLLVPSNWTGCLGVMNNYESLLLNKKALFDIPVARTASAYLTSLALAVAAFISDGSFNGGDNALFVRPQFFENNPLFSFIQYVIGPYADDLGNVLPNAVEGLGVPVDPLAFAGLLGMVVTSLNLLPCGRLEGGRIAQAMFGRSTATLLSFATSLLLGIGGLSGSVLCLAWGLFATFFRGGEEIPAKDEITPLGDDRYAWGVVLFLVCFLTLFPNGGGTYSSSFFGAPYFRGDF